MPLPVANLFLVSAIGDDIVILKQPGRLSKKAALNLAAWLVACAAYGEREEFDKLLEAVFET